MDKNTKEQGPEYPQGSVVNLALELHPSNEPVLNSKVTKTWWCGDRQCWMHDVAFCGKLNSWPHDWLKFIKERT